MSLTCGFFNSLNHDRKYDANQFSQIFDGIINDGVFMSVGDRFLVRADNGMTVNIGKGRAWFNGTWTLNDSIMNLNVEPSELLLPRIDAVILEVNHSDEIRENSIYIVKGTPSSRPERPTMIHNDFVHQYPLAYILIPTNSEEVIQSNITNMVGTSECPFVTGIIDTVDIDDLVLQWQDQWDRWIVEKQIDFSSWEAQQKIDFISWSSDFRDEMELFQTTSQNQFDDWFEHLQIELSGDVATNLQRQIDELGRINARVENGCLYLTTN